ncbi:hypothetical protein DAVIS_04834 [Mycobacterium marinum]|uniref:Uncharacterized protein n=1 Tax=Mycobacterium marinum TaxID=1781 RepID=A0A3E2MPQ5_MYCMR|nr:hypothetical protein [Mycobacterium marinum]RFZ34005.1 hypothetical protein DAVIS_04834 [Mycobacterium marinum]
MIRTRQQLCTITNDVFSTAFTAIAKSAAAETIEHGYKESSRGGGRNPAGVSYSVHAVLVALLVRFLMGRPYSLRGAMDTLGEFSADQLAAVGMAGQNCAAIWSDAEAEYKRFHRFWSSRLAPLDPDFDLPAKRMTNADHAARVRARTEEDRARSMLADQRLTVLINDLLYGSIQTAAPVNCEGDVVVDETIINTAAPDGMLGSRPERYRGASSIARYWARDKRGQVTRPGTPGDMKSSGYGIGATFVSRVARRDALHSEPTVFVGMDVHAPTSGSVDGLATGLAHARRNAIDGRRAGTRTRRPLLTADMGYNPKNGFAELMLHAGYSPVVRYPKHWAVQYPSALPPGAPTGPEPGPVQYAGAFYCPAVIKRIAGHRTPSTEELLSQNGFNAHDRRLQSIYPFLMGLHSRPAMADCRSGRPRLNESPPPQRVKIRQVCPAALGTVMCPHKPESMHTSTLGLPLAEPDWPADAMACCNHSSITVYLTDTQLKMAQWELIPGSWEHTLYFEAARALTEQRFSQLKSRHVAGLDSLNTGPRRTPMIKIAVALAAVTVNIRAQQNHEPKRHRREAVDIRLRQLAAGLGRPPTLMPRRS